MRYSSLCSLSREFGITAVLGVYLISLVLVWPVGDFPLLDDWVYARSAVASAAAGKIALTGYESAWTLPQIAIGAVVTKLIGVSHLAYRTLGVVSLSALVFLMNAYLRKQRISSSVRLLLSGLLLFNPVVYLLSMTFMSDLPFLVLWVAACFAWDSALSSHKRTWVIAAICLTSLAIAQRQFGILIPCTVFLLIFWMYLCPQRGAQERSRDLFVMLLAVVVTFFIGGALYLWMRAQGGYQPPILSKDLGKYFIPSNFKMTILLTLSLLPAGILIGFSSRARALYSRLGQVLSLLLVGCAVYFVLTGQSILYGNLLSPFGICRPHELLLGERPVIFMPWMNVCAMLLASGVFCMTVSAMLKACIGFFLGDNVIGKSDETPQQSATRFGVVLVGATCFYVAIFLLRGGFDRYLIPALPGLIMVAAAAMPKPSRARLRLAYGALAVEAFLSFALSSDYFRWNELKWHTAQELVAEGVPSAAIHAGYEWHGWHHGDSSPYPGGLSSGYSYFITFSNSFESLSVKSEKKWMSVLPPFGHEMFVLEARKIESAK